MIILETERLRLRQVEHDDAAFVLDLVNQPAWLKFIGDHEVYDVQGAVEYITDGPHAMFDRYGFALSLVELKSSGQPIGLCGLVKREALPDPDLGFAFLPQYWRQGYAYESAAASLLYGRERLGIERVLALAMPGNADSIRLLQRLGFMFSKLVKIGIDEPETKLFVRHATFGAAVPPMNIVRHE